MDILYGTNHYRLYLTLARLGALPFLAGLLCAAWLWARRVVRSDGEALLAVVLLSSVPSVLGHAALATLDVPAAATTLLALYMLQLWLTSGRRRHAILLGVAAGAAFATKLSAVPFLGLSAGVLFACRAALRSRGTVSMVDRPLSSEHSQIRHRIAGVALMVAAFAMLIVIAYGRRSVNITHEPHSFQWVSAYFFPRGGWAQTALLAATTHLRMPEAFWDFAEGIAALKAHNDAGHLSYLLGELRSGGWWYFYLVALAAKTPLPLLVTGPVGMLLMARDGWREGDPWRLAPAVLFLTLLVFASCYSRINIGIRHVLILYPFMALGSAYLFGWAWRALGELRDAMQISAAICLILGLIGWQISTLWTANPDYLPYFNEAVAHPERVLVDSDLDWGQDLHRLEQRLSDLKVTQLSFAYLGTADLTHEPLPATTLLPPRRRATGWTPGGVQKRQQVSWLESLVAPRFRFR
jgi:Dolichyl-phosphate-mannose-protein mannosyltransferase